MAMVIERPLCISTIEECWLALEATRKRLIGCTELVEPALTYVASLIVGDQVVNGDVLNQFHEEVTDQIGVEQMAPMVSYMTNVLKGATSEL
jgi:hypothetical protein